MIVGFSGTRAGMTAKQCSVVRAYLHDAEFFHHGDCIGADAQAHSIALGLEIPVILHPCTLTAQRAYCQGAITTFPALPPLERNKIIVNSSQLILAAPKEKEEEQFGGTWSTIRYARRNLKYLVVIFPDSSVIIHNQPE